VSVRLAEPGTRGLPGPGHAATIGQATPTRPDFAAAGPEAIVADGEPADRGVRRAAM